MEDNHFYANRENAVDIKTCHDVTIRNNRMHRLPAVRHGQGRRGRGALLRAATSSWRTTTSTTRARASPWAATARAPCPRGIVIRRNRVHDITNEGGGEGTGIRLENSKGTLVVNNTITRVATAALILGHGTGGPTQNLTVVQNNIIDARRSR